MSVLSRADERHLPAVASLRPGPLPDGPVTPWYLILDRVGRVLGAAPVVGVPAWRWQAGQPLLDLGRFVVPIVRAGQPDHGVLVMVSDDGHFAATELTGDMVIDRTYLAVGAMVEMTSLTLSIRGSGAS